MTSTQRAAIWTRVSSDHQDSDNQIPELEQFCRARGLEIVKRYDVSDSAWKNGPKYTAALKTALDDAWKGEYEVIVVWALDRISRNGAEDVLRLIRQFRERGCTLQSVQESWLNTTPEIQDVLVAFAGWTAQMESKRRSERIRAGLERRKAQGLPVGRQPGAKDRAKRKRSGYVARYEKAQ
jgi:putative DNA-invertase from lambdoid prophage Rac